MPVGICANLLRIRSVQRAANPADSRLPDQMHKDGGGWKANTERNHFQADTWSDCEMEFCQAPDCSEWISFVAGKLSFLYV